MSDTETLRIDLDTSDAAKEAERGATALEYLIKTIDRFGSAQATDAGRAVAVIQRLGAAGRQAGSALAAGMSGTLDATMKAVSGVTKLSSALELATKRAAALKKEEKEAFDAAVKAANKTPDHLKVGPEKGSVSTFAALTGVVGKLFGPKAAQGLVSGAGKLADASEKLGPWMPLLEKGGGALMTGGKLLAVGAIAAAAAAAAITIAAGAIAAKLLYAGSELAIHATSFREETTDALAAVLRSTKEARATFDAGIEIAVKLGLDKEDTLTRIKSLVTSGFRGDELQLIITAVADIRVAKGDEAGNALQKTLEKVKAKGKFDAEAVNALAEAGIQSQLILKALSEKLGLSIEQVEGKLKSGQISVADGIKAILAAANATAGGAAEKASQSLPKLAQSARTLFESLFDDVDLGPIKEVLNIVREVLGGPEGAALKAEVTNLFGTLFKTLFAPFQGEKGRERLIILVRTLANVLGNAARVIEVAGPLIEKGVQAVVNLLDKDDKQGSGRSRIFQFLDGLLGLSALIGGVDWTPALHLVEQIFTAIENLDFSSLGSGLGSKLVAGLIAGILGGAAGVVSALVGVVAQAIAGASGPKGADAHSPSRKTGKIGGWMGEGLVVQMMAWRDRAAGAGESLASRAVGAMTPANDNDARALAQPSGASGGGNVQIVVHVNIGPGARADAATVQQAAEQGAYQGFITGMRQFARVQRKAVG